MGQKFRVLRTRNAPPSVHFPMELPQNIYFPLRCFDTEFKNIIHMTAFVLLIYDKMGMYLSKAPL